MHFRNPGGRIVEIDDPEQIERYKNKPGFELIGPQEIAEYQSERVKIFEQQRISEELALNGNKNTGVYFSTVSQNYKSDGYGVASACMIDELKRLGVDVKTTYNGQKVGVLFHNPYSIMNMQTDFRVIYTMFESDKIPDDWIEYLEMADLVLVPSKWCQSVFAKAGIKAEVLTLGYDDLSYTPVKRENKRELHKTFNFLHYNAFNIRKGFPEVFKAFVSEFAPDEPVRLILKTTQNYNQIPSPFRGIESQYPNIKIIADKLPDKKMVDLLAESDCFVFPSRGEGFGMTPLETMATGMPAILLNAHGMTEYFNNSYMYGVELEGTCPALYNRYKGIDVGKMVVSNIDDLRRKMRYVYEHQEEALKKGMLASEYVKSWTLRKTAKKLKEIIDNLLSKPSPDRKLKNILSLERVT